MVGRDSLDAFTQARTVDDLVAVDPLPTHGDVVSIVPSLAEKQHVDQLFTSHVEQVVELVGERPNVEGAEHELRNCRR